MKKIVPANAILIPRHAQLAFEGVVHDVYQWPQVVYNGGTETFEMVRRPDTVDVLCLVNDGVLAVRNERLHRGVRTSLPGGRVERGEEVLTAARREVREETGYEFAQWRLLQVWQPSTMTEWFIHLYLASEGAQTSEPQPDTGERLTLERLTLGGLKRFVQSTGSYPRDFQDTIQSFQDLQDLLALPPFRGKEIEY